jgi:hypothetical protein
MRDSPLITRLPTSPTLPRLRAFVAAMSTKEIQVPNRRRFPRWPRVTNITVVPLDSTLRPIGSPTIACTRNISSGGICLYQPGQNLADLLYLEIETTVSSSIQVLMSPLRQTAVDQFWEVAGTIRLATEFWPEGEPPFSVCDDELAAIDRLFAMDASKSGNPSGLLSWLAATPS